MSENLKKAQKILRKLEKVGNFIEHIDGNTMNNAVSNLRWVRFSDWLENPTKKIDWVCHVTADEQAFVRLNVENFRIMLGITGASISS